MDVDRRELGLLSRMFSATVFRELGRKGASSLLSRLLFESRLMRRLPEDVTVGDAFEEAFNLTKVAGSRDEYVYRSALAQKVVLGKHSLHTAVMLNEISINSSKADVVVLNGTSTAYEIKSERDTLMRLSKQVADYAKTFSAVNVVTTRSHVKNILDLVPREVGVIVLSQVFTLQVERPAQSRPDHTCPLDILKILRADEAGLILGSLGRELPKVPNTRLRAALAVQFAQLDPLAVHDKMVETLKMTRSQSGAKNFVNSLPRSLRAAALSVKIKEEDQARVRLAMCAPIHTALDWK